MPQLGLVPTADKICFHWDLISIMSRHFGSNHIGSNHFIVVRTCGGWGIPKGGWNLEYSTALLPTQRRFLAAGRTVEYSRSRLRKLESGIFHGSTSNTKKVPCRGSDRGIFQIQTSIGSP